MLRGGKGCGATGERRGCWGRGHEGGGAVGARGRQRRGAPGLGSAGEGLPGQQGPRGSQGRGGRGHPRPRRCRAGAEAGPGASGLRSDRRPARRGRARRPQGACAGVPAVPRAPALGRLRAQAGGGGGKTAAALGCLRWRVAGPQTGRTRRSGCVASWGFPSRSSDGTGVENGGHRLPNRSKPCPSQGSPHLMGLCSRGREGADGHRVSGLPSVGSPGGPWLSVGVSPGRGDRCVCPPSPHESPEKEELSPWPRTEFNSKAKRPDHTEVALSGSLPPLGGQAASGGPGCVYLEVVFLDLFREDRASVCCRGGTLTPFCLS